MAVHLRCLLILTGLTGIHSITTVSEVSVKAGDSISIPCFYDLKYMNNVKYLCKGSTWRSCSYAIKTNQQNSEKFSISDDKSQRIFTVTIKDLKDEDTDYWCAVDRGGWLHVKQKFHLSVTRGTPSLYVDHQEITGFRGDDLTISCHYRNSGETQWCRPGVICVTPLSGSIDGTRVTINASVPNVFTVTMSELRMESSGWYWCFNGNLEMPVHVTVTEKPTTTTSHFTTLSSTPEPVNVTTVFTDKSFTTVQGDQHSRNVPVDLYRFIIPLSLLISLVMVALCIWFMFKRHKQTKVESSATTMLMYYNASLQAQEEVTYSTVEIKRRTSGQGQGEVTYSTVKKKKITLAPAEEEVTYSNVKKKKRTLAPAEEEVTYSNVSHVRKSSVKSLEDNADVMYSSVVSAQKTEQRQ